MTFALIRPTVLYGSRLASSEFNTLQINATRSVDGYGGGNYQALDNLTIGAKTGKTMKLASQLGSYISVEDDTVEVGSPMSTDGYFSAFVSRFYVSGSFDMSGHRFDGTVDISELDWGAASWEASSFSLTTSTTTEFHPSNYFYVYAGNDINLTGAAKVNLYPNGDVVLNPNGIVEVDAISYFTEPVTFGGSGRIKYPIVVRSTSGTVSVAGNKFIVFRGQGPAQTLTVSTTGCGDGDWFQIANESGSYSLPVSGFTVNSGSITVSTQSWGRYMFSSTDSDWHKVGGGSL